MVSGLPGWLSFLIVGLIAVLVLAGGWLLVRASEGRRLPHRLAVPVVLAAVLHLAAGVLWYYALPVLGHDSAPEQAGYIMADAHQRDQVAWNLARDDQPLWSAFRNNRAADQYGGMLFISALVYRYLGGVTHQPLLMVVIGGAFSALAVLFAWVLARRTWDEKVAWLTAWVLVVYPELIILGSSQMREAYLIPLATAAFYGLVRSLQEHDRISLAWATMPVLLMVPLSPPAALLTLGLVVLCGVYAGGWRLNRPRSRMVAWLAAAGLLLLVLAAAWFALQQFAPQGMTNPLQVLEYWLRKSSDMQAFLVKHSSGWLKQVLNSVPAWLQMPILVGYGVVQPFLPAALIATSDSSLWTGIAIFRAVGWSLLLAVLLYATLLAFGKRAQGKLNRAFVAVIWLGVLVAAYRGGGDQWDNPRYRAVFVGLQVGVACWAWVQARRERDPWFRRAWLALFCILLWFVPWYLHRYTPLAWPVVDLFKTIGLGLATLVLVLLWDWARSIKTEQK
jgi:hypothetical protein